MLRVTQPQRLLWEEMLPENLRELPPELKAIDRYLDDDRFLEPFLKRGQQRMGRPTTPIDRYLRLMYLKHSSGLGYEKLIETVNRDVHWRRFCHYDWTEPLPNPSTLVRLTQRFGAEAVQELNKTLVDKMIEDKHIKGRAARRMRTDTTVTEAEIKYPTDAGLLSDGVRVITRTVEKVKELGEKLGRGFHDRTRSMRKRLWDIGASLKKRLSQTKEQAKEAGAKAAESAKDSVEKVKEVAQQVAAEASSKVAQVKRQVGEATTKAAQDTRIVMGQLKRVAREAIDNVKSQAATVKEQVNAATARAALTTEEVLEQARSVAARLRRFIGKASGQAKKTAERLYEQLTHWIELTERALEQTCLRLQGVTSIPNRMVSLFDPDARPICKGKLSQPVEFGYKVEVSDVEQGVVTDYQVHVGNPQDSTLLVGAVERHTERLGRPPEEVAADRGYYSNANEKALEEMGVKRVSTPVRGKRSARRKEHEGQAWFQRLQRFRAGSEGRISVLKRRYGMRKSRLRGKEGTSTWVGFGVFAHNLVKMATLTASKSVTARSP